MSRQKFLHRRWIGFTARRVGLGSQELLVEALRRVYCKDGDVVHPSAPFLAASRKKLERHASHHGGRVGLKGHAAGKGETTDQGDAAHCKDPGLRKGDRAAVALEPT